MKKTVLIKIIISIIYVTIILMILPTISQASGLPGQDLLSGQNPLQQQSSIPAQNPLSGGNANPTNNQAESSNTNQNSADDGTVKDVLPGTAFSQDNDPAKKRLEKVGTGANIESELAEIIKGGMSQDLIEKYGVNSDKCNTMMTFIESRLYNTQHTKNADGTITYNGDNAETIYRNIYDVFGREVMYTPRILTEIYNKYKTRRDQLIAQGDTGNANLTVEQAVEKLKNGESVAGASDDVINAAMDQIRNDPNLTDDQKEEILKNAEQGLADNKSAKLANAKLDQAKVEGSRVIYTLPDRNAVGAEKGEVGLDQAIEDSEKFLEGSDKKYDDQKMREFAGSLYNVMLSLGVIAAIAVGGTIGLKIMLGGLEAKAEAKQLLVPYVVGCVVVFGGFGIWKLIIEIFQQM